MIEPQPWDVGRPVIYRPNTQHLWGGFKSPDQFVQEEGVLKEIVKDNVDVVIVEFKGDTMPRKVKIDRLSWKDD